MIATIARKEFQDLVRDRRFRISAWIVGLLLFTALAVGFSKRQDYEQQRAGALASERRAWVNQGDANPHSAAHFGRYAFKPLLPAALLDNGLNSYLGVAVYIEGHAQNPFRFRPAEDSTGVAQFGELTAAAVLQILLPLVIVLLTFPAFAGEREQGTLKQLLSLGVGPSQLLWGKCLGIVAALCLLLIPATAAGAWVLTMGVAAPGDSSFPRFLAMGGAYAVYLLSIVALALGVSARAASSRVALLVLVGFWIANSLLVPRVAASVAEALHPTPSLQEFLKQVHLDLENGVDGHRPPGEREAELKRALMKKYNVTSEKDLPLNLSGYFLQQSEEFGNEIFEKRFGELSETYGRQQLVLRAAAGVSPMLAARAFSMGMAGTDLWHHRQFAAAAEQYRRNWVKRLNDDLTYQSRTGDTSYKVGRPFWEATQDFVYQSEPFGAAASAQAWSLGILLAWLAGSTAFAFLAIRRLSGQVA